MILRYVAKGRVPDVLELPGAPGAIGVLVAVQVYFPVPEADRGMDLRGARLSMDGDHSRDF
jgi:hypothetical protein